jgi:hypothetical protein
MVWGLRLNSLTLLSASRLAGGESVMLPVMFWICADEGGCQAIYVRIYLLLRAPSLWRWEGLLGGVLTPPTWCCSVQHLLGFRVKPNGFCFPCFFGHEIPSWGCVTSIKDCQCLAGSRGLTVLFSDLGHHGPVCDQWFCKTDMFETLLWIPVACRI